jgi:uncharacterized membrane protein YkvA (DUF1232 family)
MSRERHPVPIQPDDTSATLAWFKDIARQARLAWRLFWDQRVPMWTKVVPSAALVYVVSPVDLVPAAVVPGLGQLDDLAILLIGVKLFIELAPPQVVREHLLELGARIQEWRVEEESEPPVVIEGEYKLQEPEAPEAEIES